MGGYRVRKILFLFFLFQACIAYSQQPALEFRTLDALKNIINSFTTDITQDSVGFLWIGTHEGLFRFDGKTCNSYYQNENDSTTIPSNKIYKLFVDRNKTLWITTSNGVCRYNPEYDNFTQIVSGTDLKGMPGSDISVLNEDNLGNLYLALGEQVFMYNKTSHLFSKVIELDHGNITRIVFDNQNNIWIASFSNGGLFYFDRNTKQLKSFRNDLLNKQTASNNEIRDIKLIKDKLWIATYGAGIDCYNLKDRTFKNYTSPNYYENFAFDIFIDHKNNIWICTLGSLKLYNPESDNFYNYYNDPKNPESLGKNPTCFFQDKQGNYWSLHAMGEVRHTEIENRFKHFNTNPAGFWNTSENTITAISSDIEGNLWIGNFYNGIDVFRLQEHRIDRYIHKDGDLSSLGNGTIFTIFRDSKNQMWVGSNMGGLQKFNSQQKIFESFLHKPNDTLSIAGNDIRSVSEDTDGNLWVAVQGKGVDRFDPKSKTFRHYDSQHNQLSNDYTFQVLNDSKGNLWVATAYGLNQLPKNGTTFKSFLYSKNDSTTISSSLIQTIYEDRQHTIWVGTPKGLNKYNPGNESFTRYVSELKNKNVYSILSDLKNNIWYSSNTGISKFNPGTKKVINFEQNDGLLSRVFYPQSCYTGDHHVLFFGGTEGIDLFDPDSLNFVIKPLKVYLTDFKISNKSVSYRTSSNLIDKYIAYAKQINLDHNSNSIAFSYQAIKLTKPEKITYSVKLDGFDREWNNVGDDTDISYNNLKPGKYIFKVRSRYDDGDWSENVTLIQIYITPPWWMSIWFILIACIIMVITPLLIINWRTKRLLRKQKKLETLVAERTREIQQKNDQLKDLNSTKDKLFSIISHDLRSPFNAILGFQDLLLNSYAEFSDTERLNMIRQVYSTTNQAYHLVENLLNWARIQTNNIHHHPVKFNLGKVVLEKLDLYRDIAEAKGISFNYQLPEELVAFADINLLDTTLRNLINNAIKFTPRGGFILIKASQELDIIKISVIDSGTGMTREQIETLFNIEKTHSIDGTNGEKGSGLGLVLCKEFVEINKGSISVESQVGKGSIISFTIPDASQK